MSKPAAKRGDQITALDWHIVLVPSASGTTPTPMQFPFNGIIDGELSSNVQIMGKPAATAKSTASNKPSHMPPPSTTFQAPPSNKGVILDGSHTVLINGRPAARAGDPAQTCADPAPNMAGKVVAAGTVLIGD